MIETERWQSSAMEECVHKSIYMLFIHNDGLAHWTRAELGDTQLEGSWRKLQMRNHWGVFLAASKVHLKDDSIVLEVHTLGAENFVSRCKREAHDKEVRGMTV